MAWGILEEKEGLERKEKGQMQKEETDEIQIENFTYRMIC